MGDLETGTSSAKANKRQNKKMEREERQYRRMPKPLEPRTKSQSAYISSLHMNDLTFGVGPAGVGKTYVPARVYGQLLIEGRIEKLYISRPNVSKSKHRNGFLPGTLEEKTAPWLVPIFDGIRDSMAPFEFERLRREKIIEEVPYEFMQGRTFKDAAWIVDEAENLDLDDLYITLTRQGENLKTVLCGDPRQARISNSGLLQVVEMADSPEMESIGVIKFTEEDVIRSRQARQWVLAFNRIPLSAATFCGNEEDKDFRSNLPHFMR